MKLGTENFPTLHRHFDPKLQFKPMMRAGPETAEIVHCMWDYQGSRPEFLGETPEIVNVAFLKAGPETIIICGFTDQRI